METTVEILLGVSDSANRRLHGRRLVAYGRLLSPQLRASESGNSVALFSGVISPIGDLARTRAVRVAGRSADDPRRN